jgi:hypothetical protein
MDQDGNGTMTATADFMAPEGRGGNMLVQGARRLAGAVLGAAALVLWLAPGADWGAEVLPFRLALTCVAAVGAWLMLRGGVPGRHPRAEIDTIRREVRLVRLMPSGARAVLRRCRFAELGPVELSEARVILRDAEGAVLAEVSLADPRASRSLLAGLRDAGKLPR